jgi:cytosine/adenosine deaminase-related metal-dependent hydrolase
MILRLETSSGDVLALEDGRIASSDARPDVTVNAGEGRFLPGLINAHDHLHRNHYPRLGSPPYEDAYAWGADIHARHAEDIARAKLLDRSTAYHYGALKNVLGGATTVVHHDDRDPALEWSAAKGEGFPIRVARVRTAHSLGFERSVREAAARGPEDAPLCIHLAEGVNARAAAEVGELQGLGLLDARLLAVHVVGVDGAGIALLRGAGAAIVWCPTSNFFLLGATAPRAVFDSGIDVLLGTDSLLTGDGTLLDELRAARSLGYMSDERLLAAAGATAAKRLHLPRPSLEPGAAADVILLRAPIFEATAADVALVLVGGRVVVADPGLGEALGAEGVVVRVKGEPKIVDARLARAAERVSQLFPDGDRLLS